VHEVAQSPLHCFQLGFDINPDPATRSMSRRGHPYATPGA